LPKRLPGASKQPIRLTSRSAFQGPEQVVWRHQRSNQQVNVIRHDDIRTQLVVPQLNTFVDRRNYELRDFGLLEIKRPSPRIVHLTVQPQESLARC
jgi:hypothetical protein